MPFGLDSNFYLKVLPLILIESVLFSYAFTSDVRTRQVIFGLVGLWWCLAALWVEYKLEKVYPGFEYDNPVDPKMTLYKPFCDFAPWAKCSRVLMSPSGRMLRFFGIALKLPENAADKASPLDRVRNLIDVPNPTLGLLFFSAHLFYPALLLIPILNTVLPWLFLAACCVVGLLTCWLAYKLFIVLQDFCVVCVSQYVVNFGIIPMMWGICNMNKVHCGDFADFFGSVPSSLLYPFMALNAVMFAGVMALFSTMTTHAREPLEPLDSQGDSYHPLLSS